MKTTEQLASIFDDAVADPMWADHTELSKATCKAVAAELRRLAAEVQQLTEERTAWRVTAENAEAAVKQARIDALEEARQACEAEADESKLSAPGASDGRYDWKEDGARDCAAAIESLKGTP